MQFGSANRAVFLDELGDESTIERRRGRLLRTDDGGRNWIPIPGRSGLISGGNNSEDLANALAEANANGGGYVIECGKGTYNLTSQIVFQTNGNTIMCNGPGATFFNIDDAHGMAGRDAVLFNSVLNCGIKGVTFTANGTARTSGSMFKVLGKNHITATPAERTSQYVIEDVDAEDQFDGLVINDGPNGQGAWGGFLNRISWIRFGAGGTYIDVNTPNGGQQYLSNIQLYGSAASTDSQRALAAVRYRGGADLEIINLSAVYMRYGYLCNPVGQAANVGILTGCDWDNNTRASLSFTPSAGGSCIGHRVIDGWGYTVLSGLGYPCIDFNVGAGCNADNNAIRGGDYWGNLMGARLSAAVPGGLWNILIDGCNFSSDTTGILVTSSTTDFQLTNNTMGLVSSSFPLVGIQIDAGCDYYSVTGNNLRRSTTPIINTPGVAADRRIVERNILP